MHFEKLKAIAERTNGKGQTKEGVRDFVFGECRRILADHCGIEQAAVTEEKKFDVDYGMDSLDDVELVMAIEDTFEIQLLDERVENAKSLKDIVDLLIEGTTPSAD